MLLEDFFTCLDRFQKASLVPGSSSVLCNFKTRHLQKVIPFQFQLLSSSGNFSGLLVRARYSFMISSLQCCSFLFHLDLMSLVFFHRNLSILFLIYLDGTLTAASLIKTLPFMSLLPLIILSNETGSKK